MMCNLSLALAIHFYTILGYTILGLPGPQSEPLSRKQCLLLAKLSKPLLQCSSISVDGSIKEDYTSWGTAKQEEKAQALNKHTPCPVCPQSFY